MFQNKVVIFALCGVLAAASAGCGKAKPVYETVEAAEEYQELRNIKIYSDTSTDGAVGISASVTENTDGTITSGGSTTPKAADPTPAPGGNASQEVSSGNTPTPTPAQAASSGQTAPSVNYNTGTGSSPFSPGTVVQTNPSPQGTTTSGRTTTTPSTTQAEANIHANTIIRTLKISRTKIVDKNGVIVTATGTSDEGVDITITNSNAYDVTVTIENVLVNNADTGLSITKTVKAGKTVYTSIPITDRVLRSHNITAVHDVSVDVDIDDTKKTSGNTPVTTAPAKDVPSSTPTSAPTAVPTAVPTAAPTEKPAPTADPPTVIPTGFPEADPTAAPATPTPRPTANPPQLPQGSTTAEGTKDYGTLIKESDGFALYAKYVREDFIYDSGILITTVNNTGELMSISCTSMTVNGRQSLSGFTAEAHRGTTTSCFHVGSSKIFSDMQSVTLNIKVKARYSNDVLWETGDFVVS